MEMPTPDATAQVARAPLKEPPAKRPEPSQEKPKAPLSSGRIPSIIVALVVAAIAGLSIWFRVRPQPLLVQGEVDATRLDIAARVEGRVGDIPIVRGQDVAAGAVLVRSTIPKRWRSTSRRWPPRWSPRRSSPTSTPARARR